MLVIPAIDLLDGKVVRLRQGDFSQVTAYADDPVRVAQEWENAGAALLHVVDLDGARTGELRNLEVVRQIVGAVTIPVQVGGGLRSLEAVEAVFSAGAWRAVLGTLAVEQGEMARELLSRFRERLVVSLDTRGGVAVTRGWTVATGQDAVGVATAWEAMGARTLILTDVQRDGTLEGSDLEPLRGVVRAVRIPVIAAGGVRDAEDIRRLAALEREGLSGVIVGRALYEGTLDVREALRIAGGPVQQGG